jgi:valine--pyruvate aminotransferase
MNLSAFGEKFTRKTGILELMEDIALASAAASASDGSGARLRMLGGGNPARIPAMEAVWKRRMEALLSDEEGFGRLLGAYDSADGMAPFRASLASLFRREYGWDLGSENICVTNGSQIAVWYLLNLLSGPDASGRRKRVLFPLMPEYVGYADQAVSEDVFVSLKPRIELRGDDRFKYFADLDAADSLLKREGDTIGGILVSRPTNPSGNVLTDAEIERLQELAARNRIPLIVDNAYGLPFPGIVFGDAQPRWDEWTVLSMSLSKIGLPSARTGIIIAGKEIIRALSSVNAIASLATGTVGQAIAEPLIASGEILSLSRDVVRPFYTVKRKTALDTIDSLFEGLPVRVHESEGAIFLWLWFQDMPIDSHTLYERLKERGVLVLSGENFSFGSFADGSPCAEWDHPRRCIRINYSTKDSDVSEGLAIIADEVRTAYAQGAARMTAAKRVRV